MIKKLFLVVLVLIAVLGGVLVFNTLQFTSKQVQVDPVAAIDIDVDGVSKRLAKAITFKTISYQNPEDFKASEFEGLHAYLERTFPATHKTLKRELVNGYTLLYTWNGSDPSLAPVILLAHMDVVPVAPDTDHLWEFGAFEGAIDGGYIWGRGALDDKVSMMALLEAVELFVNEGIQPKRTVYLAFGHDEEVGGPNGAIAAAALLKSRGVKAEFILDEGGAIVTGVLPGLDAPVAVIGIAEKGYMSVELVVEAKGGHSSQPPKETAVGILSKAISALEANQMPGGIVGPARAMFDYIGPEMGFGMKLVLANLWLFQPVIKSFLSDSPQMNAFMRTTTAPTILEAGVKENVLPAKARGVVNFRILPGDTSETVLRHIRETVNDGRVAVNVIRDARDPSKVSPTDSEAFKAIGRTVREVIPEAIVSPTLVLGGTDSRHYGELSDNIYRFSPMLLEGSDLARIHGTNERIATKTYANMIRYFHRLIQNTAL